MLNYQYLAQVPVNRPLDLSGKNLSQTAPTPAAPAPATLKLNVPVVLGVSTALGAILGFVLTKVLRPHMSPRQTKAEIDSLAKFGALGGAIGGLAGVGTVLLLKD